MRFSMLEHKWLGGFGAIGSADSIDYLPWSEVDDLNTYAVYDGNVCLAEFEGHEAGVVREWLADNAFYDGRNGCKAYKDVCDCCGCECPAGRCDCVDSVERYNSAK